MTLLDLFFVYPPVIVAMENAPFIDDFPIKTSIFHGNSVAGGLTPLLSPEFAGFPADANGSHRKSSPSPSVPGSAHPLDPSEIGHLPM